MVAKTGNVAQTMNMTDAANGSRELFGIAAITGAQKGVTERTAGLHEAHPFVLTWDDERAILAVPGWSSASWKQRIDLLHGALATFACISDRPSAELLWLFSGKVTQKSDAADLLARWIENGGPPLLDLIDLVAEQHVEGLLVKTVGLSAIVGYELEAMVDDSTHGELARMVGRLAQEVLLNGPLLTAGAIGPDGEQYRFERIARTASCGQRIRIIAKNTFKTD